MLLPEGALYIIGRLREHGERADVVGGCVRDHLLHKECSDYDITTSASPSRVEEIFCGLRLVETGIKHGTVTIVLPDGAYEVTTYRRDGEYLDNRHPSSVTFTSELSDDLSRRDFTINAMCYNPIDGITDLYGGREDLARAVVRTVGEPSLRFTEDALRIMRAIRFASVLDFTIDGETDRALRELAPLLKGISRERIYGEWQKLVGGVGAYRVLSSYRDVISVVIPQLSALSLPSEAKFAAADPTSRLLSLFYLSTDNPGESFSSAMRSLRTDNATRVFGNTVLQSYDESDACSECGALSLLCKVGYEAAEAVVRLGILIGKYDETVLGTLRRAEESGVPYKISALAVDGNDMRKLGFTGKRIGEVLSYLLEMVVSGELSYDRESLLSCANKLLDE